MRVQTGARHNKFRRRSMRHALRFVKVNANKNTIALPIGEVRAISERFVIIVLAREQCFEPLQMNQSPHTLRDIESKIFFQNAAGGRARIDSTMTRIDNDE